MVCQLSWVGCGGVGRVEANDRHPPVSDWECAEAGASNSNVYPSHRKLSFSPVAGRAWRKDWSWEWLTVLVCFPLKSTITTCQPQRLSYNIPHFTNPTKNVSNNPPVMATRLVRC